MNTTPTENTRARILDLRARIREISRQLDETLKGLQGEAAAASANLRISATALQAIALDLESLCTGQLDEPVDNANQQAAVLRAKSEVDSGEFDSQG